MQPADRFATRGPRLLRLRNHRRASYLRAIAIDQQEPPRAPPSDHSFATRCGCVVRFSRNARVKGQAALSGGVPLTRGVAARPRPNGAAGATRSTASTSAVRPAVDDTCRALNRPHLRQAPALLQSRETRRCVRRRSRCRLVRGAGVSRRCLECRVQRVENRSLQHSSERLTHRCGSRKLGSHPANRSGHSRPRENLR